MFWRCLYSEIVKTILPSCNHCLFLDFVLLEVFLIFVHCAYLKAHCSQICHSLIDKFSYLQTNAFDNYLPSVAGNSVYASEFPNSGKNENLTEGWNLVKHPKFPPPLSQIEDVEHWIRAMFIDATKK